MEKEQHENHAFVSKYKCYLSDRKVWESFSEDRKRSFAYMDSLWFSLYRDASYRDKVLSWIDKKNIFTKAYVFVPIVVW